VHIIIYIKKYQLLGEKKIKYILMEFFSSNLEFVFEERIVLSNNFKLFARIQKRFKRLSQTIFLNIYTS